MTGEPLPVLMLDASPMFSGAQRVAIKVLRLLQDQGRIHLSAWCLGEAADQLAALGVPVCRDPLPFPMPGYGNPLRHMALGRRLSPRLATLAADRVVYCNGIHSGLAAAMMGQPGDRARVHVRDILRHRPPTLVAYRWLRQRGFALAGVSGPVARNIESLGGGPALTVHDPAVDLQPTREQPERIQRIGFVGNLIHFKGPDLLLKAVGLLPEELRRNLTVVIVGPENKGHEDFARSLPALADKLGVTAEFPGKRDDVPQLMRTFDLFVLPSTWPDPFPGVVLEAIAADTPVVATRVGGVPEMVPPHGGPDAPWLCPHDPQALADTLALALESTAQERRRRLDAARDHLLTHFRRDVILDRTFRFLRDGAAAQLDLPLG